MTDDTLTAAPATAPADDLPEGWLAALELASDDGGYAHPLGADHWAFYVDAGPTLLVTFERLDAILARPDQMPMGHAVASQHGWSHLCLIARGETWFRDPAIWRHFDRLVDDAFFEDFDRVAFFGAGMGGYAAAAYAVAAPGATVLAVAPRATLDPSVSGWDPRNRRARRQDFTSRYGYAPDMIEGAGQVFILHDPEIVPDAMHAALFRGPHVTHLRAPRLGDRTAAALDQMKILQPLVEAAGQGLLSRALFADLWRTRRAYGPYLRRTLEAMEAKGRLKLAAMVCRSVSSRLQAPRFRKRLAELNTILGPAAQPPSRPAGQG